MPDVTMSRKTARDLCDALSDANMGDTDKDMDTALTAIIDALDEAQGAEHKDDRQFKIIVQPGEL